MKVYIDLNGEKSRNSDWRRNIFLMVFVLLFYMLKRKFELKTAWARRDSLMKGDGS